MLHSDCTVETTDIPDLAVVQHLQTTEWSRAKALVLAEHVTSKQEKDAGGHAEGYLHVQGRPN